RVCEDLDVSRRLLHTGYTLWANPEMSVEHALRPTLQAWLRNMFLYGRGHCFQLKRHPADFHPKFLAPAAVVLGYVAAAGLDIVRSMPPFRLAALASAHFLSIALLLAAEARRQRAGLAVWIMATMVVWLTHLGFGSGLWFELPRQRDKFF